MELIQSVTFLVCGDTNAQFESSPDVCPDPAFEVVPDAFLVLGKVDHDVLEGVTFCPVAGRTSSSNKWLVTLLSICRRQGPPVPLVPEPLGVNRSIYVGTPVSVWSDCVSYGGRADRDSSDGEGKYSRSVAGTATALRSEIRRWTESHAITGVGLGLAVSSVRPNPHPIAVLDRVQGSRIWNNFGLRSHRHRSVGPECPVRPSHLQRSTRRCCARCVPAVGDGFS